MRKPNSGKSESHNPSKIFGLPEDVAAIRAEIRKFFATKEENGRSIGSYKQGVPAFCDYDVEPIKYDKLKKGI
jgi:hypothetical protein